MFFHIKRNATQSVSQLSIVF